MQCVTLLKQECRTLHSSEVQEPGKAFLAVGWARAAPLVWGTVALPGKLLGQRETTI